MNEQRTMIYDFRQQVLRGEDLKELVMRCVGRSTEREVAIVCPADQNPDTWELTELAEWFKRKTLEEGPSFSGERDTDLVEERLVNAFDDLYEKRAEEFGDELAKAVARFILLNAFDTHWKEHLLNISIMKEGIGLRGLGQEDPMVAYKREGYSLFEDMLRAIEDEVTDYIFKLEVQRPEEREEIEQLPDHFAGGHASHESWSGGPASGRDDMEAAAYQSQSQEAPKPFVREAAKVGRNDPCSCGSGRKFKKCCGS